jgi:hypothetical protein
MSGNFHREIENINFDNFEFMPEFDFDGFFKKVQTTPKTIEEPCESLASKIRVLHKFPSFLTFSKNSIFISFF